MKLKSTMKDDNQESVPFNTNPDRRGVRFASKVQNIPKNMDNSPNKVARNLSITDHKFDEEADVSDEISERVAVNSTMTPHMTAGLVRTRNLEKMK
jgi:hypothetical protein